MKMDFCFLPLALYTSWTQNSHQHHFCSVDMFSADAFITYFMEEAGAVPLQQTQFLPDKPIFYLPAWASFTFSLFYQNTLCSMSKIHASYCDPGFFLLVPSRTQFQHYPFPSMTFDPPVFPALSLHLQTDSSPSLHFPASTTDLVPLFYSQADYAFPPSSQTA